MAVNFYLNPDLTGHLLLRPSIWVAQSYGHVFSPIESEGVGSTVLEVIKRIALFVFLIILTIPVAILIPFGLASKAISSCCQSEPPIEAQILQPQPIENIKEPIPDTLLEEEEVVATGAPAPPVIDPAVQDALDSIRESLDAINRTNINIETLELIRTELTSCGDRFNKAIFGKDSPYELDFKVLMTRINDIYRHYHFYKDAIYVSEKEPLPEGEIRVADNGNCFFDSMLWHLNLINDEQRQSNNERVETVEWMQRTYPTDLNLQRLLLPSMTEHLYAKIEHLEADRLGLLGISGTQSRIQEILSEQTRYDERVLTIISASDNGFDVTHIAPIVNEYLEEMLQPGVHAGGAELYALSARHSISIHIHAKRKREGVWEIDSRPYEIINPQFGQVRHVTHTTNHYNPYNPPASSLAL